MAEKLEPNSVGSEQRVQRHQKFFVMLRWSRRAIVPHRAWVYLEGGLSYIVLPSMNTFVMYFCKLGRIKSLKTTPQINHLQVCPLHGIGPTGGRCGSSYIPLNIYSPTYCGAAPAKGWKPLEGREWLRLIFNIHQHSICRGRLPEPHLHPSCSYTWTTVCSFD